MVIENGLSAWMFSIFGGCGRGGHTIRIGSEIFSLTKSGWEVTDTWTSFSVPKNSRSFPKKENID
jgi:hypothetical protein